MVCLKRRFHATLCSPAACAAICKSSASAVLDADVACFVCPVDCWRSQFGVAVAPPDRCVAEIICDGDYIDLFCLFCVGFTIIYHRVIYSAKNRYIFVETYHISKFVMTASLARPPWLSVQRSSRTMLV